MSDQDTRVQIADFMQDMLNVYRSHLYSNRLMTPNTTQTDVSWVSERPTICNYVIAVGDIFPSPPSASAPRVPPPITDHRSPPRSRTMSTREPSAKKVKTATPSSSIREEQSVNEIDDSEDESLFLNDTVVTQPSTRPSVSSSSAASPSARSAAPPPPSREGPVVIVDNVGMAELQNVCDALCATIPEEHRKTAVKSATIENGKAIFKLKIHPRLSPYMQAHKGSITVANKTYSLKVYATREDKRELRESF